MREQKRTEEGWLVNEGARIPKPVKGEVERKALLAQLERSTEEVVVLQAAAGYGKTTAMAEFARRKAQVSGWYPLTEEDDTPERFLKGMCVCLEKAMNLRVLEAEETGPDAKGLWELCGRLLSAYRPADGERTGFVFLDNFHFISDERIYGIITRLIEGAGGRIRFFFAVRGAFPQFLAAYLMKGKLLLIGGERLLFRSAETRLLLKRRLGEEPSGSFVQSVQEYTGGWGAGIAFVAVGIQNGCDGNNLPLLLEQAHLYDYISYEIFRLLPEDSRRFLTEASVLEEPDAALCDYALARCDSARMLADLVRDNFFLSGEKKKQNGCRFLPFFGDYLRNSVSHERKKEILLRAEEFAARKETEKNMQGGGLLKVTCLGGLAVRGRQGNVTWRTRKTRELFACLFFEEGRGLTRDVLLERLWPEAGQEKAAVLFHTTISYLRRALDGAGASDVLVVQNRTYALDPARIESDLKTFFEWKSFAKEGRIPKDRSVAEFAELYRECYMCGEDYGWIGGYREYIERTFLQTAGELSRMLMRNAEYADAALLLRRAAEVDCYEIALAELLVECLILSGNIRGAKREYENMNRICEEELGQPPGMAFSGYIKRARKWRGEDC